MTFPIPTHEGTQKQPFPPRSSLLDHVRVELLVPSAVEGVGDVQPLAIHAELDLSRAAVHPLALEAQQRAVTLLAPFFQQMSKSRSSKTESRAEPKSRGCRGAEAAALTLITKGSGWHFSSSSLHTVTGPPRRMLPPTNTCRQGQEMCGLAPTHHHPLPRNHECTLLPPPHLSHQPGLAGPGDLVLADVPMQPVADIQVLVVQGNDQVAGEGWAGREERAVGEAASPENILHSSTRRKEMGSSTEGSPGILGRIHPDTSLAGIWMASSTAQLSLCTRNTSLRPTARLAFLALSSQLSIRGLSASTLSSTCLALVEAVDDAAQGTADVALGSIGVVEELNAQGQRVLPQVKALREGTAGQIPYIQAAPKDP